MYKISIFMLIGIFVLSIACAFGEYYNSDTWGMISRSLDLLEKGEVPKAVKMLTEGQYNKDEWYYFILGVSYHLTKEYRKGLHAFGESMSIIKHKSGSDINDITAAIYFFSDGAYEQFQKDKSIEGYVKNLPKDLLFNTHYVFATLSLRDKKPLISFREHQKMLAIKPNDKDSLEGKYKVLQILEEDRGLEEYKELLKVYSSDIGLLFSLANKYTQERFDNEALKVYQDILKIEPTNAEAYGGIGQAFLNLGKLDESIDYIRRGIKYDSANFKLHALLMHAYILKNDWAEVVKEYKRMVAFGSPYPDEGDIELILSARTITKEEGNLSELANSLRRFFGMLHDTELDNIREKGPDSLFQILNQANDLNYNKRDILQAYKIYEESLKIKETATAYLGMSWVLIDDKKYSLKYIEKAQEITPNNPCAFYMKAIYYGAQGDDQEEIKNWKKVLELSPNNLRVRYLLGVKYYYLKDWKNAKHTFEEIRAIDEISFITVEEKFNSILEKIQKESIE